MSTRHEIQGKINVLLNDINQLKNELRELDRNDLEQSVHVDDCFFSIDGQTILIVTHLATGNNCFVSSVVVKPSDFDAACWTVHLTRHDLLHTSDVALLNRATKEQYLDMLALANRIVSTMRLEV